MTDEQYRAGVAAADWSLRRHVSRDDLHETLEQLGLVPYLGHDSSPTRNTAPKAVLRCP